jgi:hypothetical protein
MVGLNSSTVIPHVGTMMKPSDNHGASASVIVAPKFGGIWHDYHPKSLIPFVELDAYMSVDIFTWSHKDQDWVCHAFDPALGIHQGHSHTLQFHPEGT